MHYPSSHRIFQATLAALSIAGSVTASAGESGMGGYYESDVTRRAMARRHERTTEAEEALEKGRALYSQGDYEGALQEFRRAESVLPDAPMTMGRRAIIRDHLSNASVAVASQYRKTGRYDEAKKLLEDAIKLDPNNKLVLREMDYLNDPERTNLALTPQHVANIKKVNTSLYRAEGFYGLGLYDEAKEEFHKILRVDRYNTAARRGMEKVDNARSDYYRAAYDQNRATMLAQVDELWEMAVPSDAVFATKNAVDVTSGRFGAAAIQSKLRTIKIPSVDFEETTVEEAINFLRVKSRQLDMSSEGAGINFVIQAPRAVAGGAAIPVPSEGEEGMTTEGVAETPTPAHTAVNVKSLKIRELKLKNVPMEEVLRQITEQVGLRYKVEEYAVKILPAGSADDLTMSMRVFSVSPSLPAMLSSSASNGGAAGAGGGDADPFASSSGTKPAGITGVASVQDSLKSMGVLFPEGASATYMAGTSTLMVRNTQSNLDLVEHLLETVDKTPRQISIMTKFVEVNQENSEELSFDWIMSPFGSSDTFVGGGTNGNSRVGRTGSDFPSSPLIPGIPLDPSALVENIVTGGNRSGDGAVIRDSISGLLNNPNRAGQATHVAPGILSMTGLLSDGQFQVVMRGLSQKKGADVMTAPSIMARPGEKATIEIIREFIYPTEYEPPQLPNSVGATNTGSNSDGLIGSISPATTQGFPVTPATPTAFETRNTGVTLEIQPKVSNDNNVIDLEFSPSIVEFEGFINYGSPIQAPSIDALGRPSTVTITDNRIEMPVFSSRRVKTSLTIYDNHTVAIGGLMSEEIQNVEDKVPILGDIPLIGRLFQSKAENHIKSNIIIFVTAKIIDARGLPVRGRSMDISDSPGIIDAATPVSDGSVLPPSI